MSPIEILGKLLGGARGGGGGGGLEQLNDILRGGGGGGGGVAPPPSRGDTSSSSRQLEEMLGVGNESPSRNAPAPQRPGNTQSAQPSSGRRFPSDIFGTRQPSQSSLAVPMPKVSSDDEAVILIRAMINASKVDGDISEQEQQFILERVGDNSPSTIQFLRSEFAKAINVEEYTNSVPAGLEEKVYTLSLMSITLDTKEEADYLRSLADGLRISPEQLNQLHKQHKAPLLYA
jgi:hypothetical protein